MALFPLGILSAAGGGAALIPDYDLLETQILGSTQASITFSSLGTYSSTYKHLQIRMAARTNSANDYQDTLLRINGATTGYDSHWLVGTGSVVQSSNQINQSRIYIVSAANGNGAVSGSYGAAVIDVLDSFSTTKNKTIRALAGRVITGGEGRVVLGSGLRRSTDSITAIEIYPDASASWLAGSRFSLYGIKG